MRIHRSLLIAVSAVGLAFAPAAAQDRTPLADGITVPAGFTIETIGHVARARELAVAPNGDLFVGTLDTRVVEIPNAEGKAGPAHDFVSIDDGPLAGVTIDGAWMFFGGGFGVYRVPYHAGDGTPSAAPQKIAGLRPSGIARGHVTTTVAVAGDMLYASVGSSCNVCDPESDATRATIQVMHLDGHDITAKARHIRNAIALATNPATGTLWAGDAGQDELRHGHPYEIFDAVSAHEGTVDYGWPYCYDNRQSVHHHDCSAVTVPRVVFPAYTTPVGAAFYPAEPRGTYAFPRAYAGGAFVTLHGSWHRPLAAPRVIFVPLAGDTPRTAVDWENASAQWQEFAGGFQRRDGSRVARPTGIAIGPEGSLFVADDQNGNIYRIRPTH
jgi:hypothetical protein